MFLKASFGHFSALAYDRVNVAIAKIKSKLGAVEVSNKKAKDRISRELFIRCVKEVLPLLTTEQLESLCVSSIHAEGRYGEEISYDPYFDRTNANGYFMFDAMVRVNLAHADAVTLKMEELFYQKVHELNLQRFEQLRHLREENGASGTSGLKQMRIESTTAEQTNKAPLALLSQAIVDVDPHCPRKQLLQRLAIASNDVQVLRTTKEQEESVFQQTYDVSTMAKNLRRGNFIVLEDPPTDRAPETSASAKK
jgi:hypothetical protein